MSDNEKLTEKPSYYATIPANVRYDKELSPVAKLLYGEITCLLHFNNRCFASNKYFSRLYGISETQVSRLINQLVKQKYVKTEIEISKLGSRRLIKLPPNIFVDTPIDKNDKEGVDKNGKLNKHSINNKSLTNVKDSGTQKIEKSRNFVIPTLEALKEYFISRGAPEKEEEKFFDFYTSKGWMVGKNKMKDWESAVRNWMRKFDKEKPKEEKQEKISF